MSPIWNVPIPLRASAEGIPPLRKRPAMAFSTRAAAAVSPRKSNIIWMEATIPRGQATFFPAYLGAEPWMGSKANLSERHGCRFDAFQAT